MSTAIANSPNPPCTFHPGQHMCCFYDSSVDQQAILTTFLREGLDHGEKLIYIVDETRPDDVFNYLHRDGVDTDSCVRSGQLNIIPATQAYTREKIFNPEQMFAFWDRELRSAQTAGYKTLRVTGETTWAKSSYPGAERLIEYEARLNDILPGSPYIVLCQYALRQTPAPVLLDVLYTHPELVVGTDTYENFYYMPPSEFLGGDAERAKMQRWITNVVQRNVAERALLDLQGKLHGLVDERTHQLQLANRELQRYTAELERSNAELHDFAFVASHDLQEPLRKMMLFADVLRQSVGDNIPDSSRDALARLLRASRNMSSMIEGLMQYSRVSSLEPAETVDLAAVVRQAIAKLADIVEQTGARFEISDLPTVSAGPTQMLRLFENLISNSLRFRCPDVPPRVCIAGHPGPEHRWTISVTDNGIGFADSYAERLFKPFQRLHQRSEFPGVGMGLAICRKIVTQHGGAITAHGREGQGSTFTITLPASPECGAVTCLCDA